MTRNVTMTIRKPDGSLWVGATVTFDLLTKLTVTGTDTIFQSQVSVTTDANGQATATLETPAEGDGAWLWRCTPPDSNTFDFALEYGASALDLSTIVAAISLANIAPSAVAALLAAYLPLSGGTLTGKLTLDGAPSADLHAATKKYVDDNAGGVSDHGTLTGLADDDHAQYLTSGRHAAITGNPHGTTAAEVGAQASSAKLSAIDGLTWLANSILWLTDTASAVVQTLANHVVNLLQSADAAAARTAIGAGTGNGDVTAASTFGTDNRVLRSDGTGKGVQSSGVTIDDSDNVNLPNTANLLFSNSNKGILSENSANLLWISSFTSIGIRLYNGSTYVNSHKFMRLQNITTAQTVTPNAAGDVTLGLSGTYTISDGAGNFDGGVIDPTTPGNNFNLFDDGGTNTCQLQVAADGSVTVVRTAGSRTYAVNLYLNWM